MLHLQIFLGFLASIFYIPFVCLFLASRPNINFILKCLAILSYGVFTYLTKSLYSSGIYLLSQIFFAAAVFLLLKHRNRPTTKEKFSTRLSHYILSFFVLFYNLFFTSCFIYEAVNAPSSLIKLKSPLDQTSVVYKGGLLSIFNHHKPSKEQEMALDIALPFEIEDFYHLVSDQRKMPTYGLNLYAPCDGLVEFVKDGFDDYLLGRSNVEEPAGNHLIISCQKKDFSEKVFIFLAHLKKGSICVQASSDVKTGQLIGSVGLTGNTSMPHLHLHAYYINSDGKKIGIPVSFENNKTLFRGNVINAAHNQ